MADAEKLASALQVILNELRALVREEAAASLAACKPAESERLTRQQLAKALDVHVKTVDKMRDAGMPWMLVGDVPRFELDRVLAWCRERAMVASAPAGLRVIGGGK